MNDFEQYLGNEHQVLEIFLLQLMEDITRKYNKYNQYKKSCGTCVSSKLTFPLSKYVSIFYFYSKRRNFRRNDPRALFQSVYGGLR